MGRWSFRETAAGLVDERTIMFDQLL